MNKKTELYKISYLILGPMKKAVTLKALKNKDRMSVETALEVFSPKVSCAIPAKDIVTTIVPEIYTFWKQNRPGTVLCPVDVIVHHPTGTIFFTDQKANQVMMSNLHCPAMVSSVAGESKSGLRDGKNSLFKNPSGICIYNNLLFISDTGNSSIRVVDISRIVSKKKDAAVLEETELANENQEDAIPLTSKHTITTTIKLISTSSRQLLKPFSICIGRLLEQEYPEIYVGDIELGTVFKLTDLSLGTACKGRLR